MPATGGTHRVLECRAGVATCGARLRTATGCADGLAMAPRGGVAPTLQLPRAPRLRSSRSATAAPARSTWLRWQATVTTPPHARRRFAEANRTKTSSTWIGCAPNVASVATDDDGP